MVCKRQARTRLARCGLRRSMRLVQAGCRAKIPLFPVPLPPTRIDVDYCNYSSLVVQRCTAHLRRSVSWRLASVCCPQEYQVAGITPASLHWLVPKSQGNGTEHFNLISCVVFVDKRSALRDPVLVVWIAFAPLQRTVLSTFCEISSANSHLIKRNSALLLIPLPCQTFRNTLAPLAAQLPFPNAPPPEYSVSCSSVQSPLSSSTISNASRASAPIEPSKLQPRLAVLLGVPKQWHLPLSLCRALSTGPAGWWALRCSWILTKQAKWSNLSNADHRIDMLEVLLAMLWCSASAYLSYFFTDCLMSRWLLRYAPAATSIRLLTLNTLNLYLTSYFIQRIGGVDDPRRLLPAWIGIACFLWLLYYLTQRSSNIRRETSAAIRIFGVASFCSVLALLGHTHYHDIFQEG